MGVIIEAKKPSNKAEMLSVEKMNTKALHELILYYMRERISGNNLELKHLMAITILNYEDCLSLVKRSEYGATRHRAHRPYRD